ncbi:MAG: ABC transporter substrate-binding protein, partial [Leptospiraceae bacterium]|nr:ABC transporter substrate-binding protein [Leptospiraceae bacterium]
MDESGEATAISNRSGPIAAPDLPVPHLPERIVCLTEESVELLYTLGEQHRIVGISVYVVRPERARKEKPMVTSFIKGDVEKIKALNPDLILGFSDIQADLAAGLIREGLPVW